MAGIEVPFSFETALAGDGARFDPAAAAGAARRVLADASGAAAFLDVPGDGDALDAIVRLAAGIPERFTRVLVLGIGGSGLGTTAAIQALGPALRGAGGREVRVLSNVDPVSVAEALAWFDPADTLLDVVTKSGTTVETLAQFALFLERIRAARGDDGPAEGVVITTDPERGAARRIAARLGCRTVDVPPRVGGRFSVLTGVGLFPIALAGYDVVAMVRGAARVASALAAAPDASHPSVLSAAIHHAWMDLGLETRVLWAYCDRFAGLGDWFCQLWAESLGKRRGDGAVGQTPLRAIGSTDQHSLLQLFMEGPPDKCFTFVTVGGAPRLAVPDLSALDPEMAEFAGRDLGDVFDALRQGTMAGLVQAGRPLVRIHVPRLDEEAVGALLAHFEVETAVAGYLLGVDPFDQPGVEAGKRFAHGILGRPGMEAFRDEAARLLAGGRKS